MATYKVLQDIEAEDKFLGPLTLKQFIFGAIALVGSYLSFLFVTKGMWILALPFLPVIIFTGFLAFPWGRDQPTETWLLAKLRFYFKPRKRIWDQTGIQELVKITAPKKVEQYFSDNLSQNEVKSRLKALADTIDSRGWAVKNVSVNMYTQPSYGAMSVAESSDRLVDASTLPQAVSTIDVSGIVDMFDDDKLSTVNSQIEQSDSKHKAQVIETMRNIGQNPQPTARQNTDFWFMNQPANSTNGLAKFGTAQMVNEVAEPLLPEAFDKTPSMMSIDEQAALDKIKAGKHNSHHDFLNHKSVNPTSAIDSQNINTTSVTALPDADTIRLAGNNDRNIESLARESNQIHQQDLEDEVVISLH